MTTMTAPAAQSTEDAAPVITKDIQQRVQAIIDEMNANIKERSTLIHDIWAARIAQLHVLMLGPGGTGKSFLARQVAKHIIDSVHFEVALDETSDPSEVFGPPDIKLMVENGRATRVVTGMLPQATEAFLDEFFNANGPVLHSMMPALNERVHHNGGVPMQIPLRQALMGTNKLNADADQAALFDRVHIRHVVGYIQDRSTSMDMIGDAIARMALIGRGAGVVVPGQQVTTVTLAELDQAHNEALSLVVPQPVFDLFLDIRDELQHGKAQVQISDRRLVESMAAVMGNAWVRGHETVQVGDLDILASMWWTVQEQLPEARSVILAATNPGEKAALDLLDEMDKVKEEIKAAESLDDSRKKRIGVEQVKNIERLVAEAQGHLQKAQATGASTVRIQEVIDKARTYKLQIGRDIFGLDPNAQQNLNNAASV